MAHAPEKKYQEEIEDHELDAIEENAPITAPAIFESIRRQGESELNRPISSLMMSGLIAGLALGFSVLAEGLLRSHLPDTEWRPLVDNLGYSIGFIIVILGQMQLFTENTITAVCPALDDPGPAVLRRLGRLWSVVLIFNLLGAAAFGLVLHASGPYQPDVWDAMVDLSLEATGHGPAETLLRGVGAGWLIAVLVWMRPNSHHSELWLIMLITYLIALADFSHVVAGMTEVTLLVAAGLKPLGGSLTGYVLPALVGNVLGGTVFFTLLAWAQIRAELARESGSNWRDR